MDTRITLPFADGDYAFWLPMHRVVAAEREMGRKDSDGVKQPRSIFATFYDIGSNIGSIEGENILAGPSPALMTDAHAVIRNALCGGNEGKVGSDSIAVGDAAARDLVETYCYPARPAIHDLGLAWQILKAAIYGIAPGSKKKGEPDSDPPLS